MIVNFLSSVKILYLLLFNGVVKKDATNNTISSGKLKPKVRIAKNTIAITNEYLEGKLTQRELGNTNLIIFFIFYFNNLIYFFQI